MSRTLSEAKLGLTPIISVGALSYQPSCGDRGVSFRRSSLQFNIRPARLRAGQSLLRLRAASSLDSLLTRVAHRCARKRRPGFAPTASDRTARMGDGYGSAGLPAGRRVRPIRPCGRRPRTTCQLARRGDVGRCSVLSPWPACPPRRATDTPDIRPVAWRWRAGPGPGLARSAECREHDR